MPNFQSGIYRHYNNGQLYFASQVRLNHTSGEWIVCYDALYPDARGSYWKPINEFGELMKKSNELFISRFTLVHELPAEKMQMLLSGNRVKRKNTTAFIFTVVDCIQGEKSVFVNTKIDLCPIASIPILEFLKNFELADH